MMLREKMNEECANVTARVSGFHSQDRTTLVDLTEKKQTKQANE
jgi:hypothetical protein